MAKGVAEEYASSLSDLTVNSKPLINMLTMLAEDYIEHSPTIVRTVESHLQRVPVDHKLPVLYLIDSIVKNVGGTYVGLFTQNIVSTFCSVFEQVNESIRSQMFKLRQTWNEVFPAKKLYALDARVHSIDPAWPITAPPPHGRIHLNPKFLNTTTPTLLAQTTPETSTAPIPTISDTAVREELLKKQKELLELQKRKVELELLQTKAILEEQQKKLETQTACLKTEVSQHSVPAPKVKSSSTKESAEPVPPTTVTSEVKSNKSKLESTRRRDPRLNSRKVNDPRLSSKKEGDPRLSSRKESDPRLVARKENDPRLNARRESQKIPPVRSQPECTNIDDKTVPCPPIVHKQELPEQSNKPAYSEHSKKTSDKTSSSSSSSRHQKKKSEKYRKHKEHKPRMQVLFGDPPDNEMDANKIPSKKIENNSVSKHIDISIKIDESGSRNKNDDMNTHVSSSVTYKRETSEPPSNQIENKDVHKPRREPKVEKMEVFDAEDQRISDHLSHNKGASKPDLNERKDKVIPRPVSDPIPMDIDEKVKGFELEDSKSVEIIPKFYKMDDVPIFHHSEKEPAKYIPDCHKSDLPPINSCGDTDLRLLPPQAKSDTEPPPEKKSKADLNKLFGESDVDLRQTFVPVPPPPPIISKGDFEFNEGWANIKRSNTERNSSGKSPKKRKSLVCSPRSSIFKKKEVEESQASDAGDIDVEDRNHSLIMIMKEAEEQLKNETITYAQYNQMLKGVMSMNEESKLQEAIMKDELERIDSPESGSNSSADFPNFDKDVPSPSQDSSDSFKSHSTNNESKSITDDNLSEQSKTSNETNENNDKDHGHERRRTRFNKGHDQQFHRSKTSRSRYYNQNEPPFFAENNKPWVSRHQAPGFAPRLRKETGFRWSFQPHRQKTDYPVMTPPTRMRTPRHHPEISLPPADPSVLDLINSDPMTCVNVGNSPKEVRFYGENAIVMLDWDDPRDLMFQPGSRRVFIDGVDIITLQLNAPYREITLNYGLRMRIRLGAPTRELFIDGRFYEIQFGGPPVEVILSGRKHLIQLEGPLPFLQIGQTRRTDLVAGKVNLIIDGKIDQIFPIYLDAKPQKFEICNVPFIIRFVEALQTVVINGQPLKIQFGGIPVPIFFRGERHFLRLTSLPPGINPGYVNILNMEGGRMPTPPPPRIAPPPPIINDGMPPLAPPLAPPAFMNISKPYEFPPTNQPPSYSTPSDYPSFPVSTTTTTEKPVDLLTSLMPPPIPRFALQNYIVEPHQESVKTSTVPVTTAATPAIASISTPSIDVIDLYQKLVAIGVVSPLKDKEEPVDELSIKPVDFSKPETLKVKQPGLINKLYSGIQCSSCGVRFSPEQTVKYSQHLDWHFRQNRRERNSSRIAQSRRWNYDVSDWIQYQEIEDDEDRAQSWFEIQDKRATGEEEEETAEPSVPAKGFGENPCCTVCRDKFDQFFNEDKEEWQLKRAVCVEDKLYHPVCLKDEQENAGRTVDPVMMPVPETEDEPIETIDLEAVGDNGEEEKMNIETIDIESSKSPDEEDNDKAELLESPEILETEKEDIPSSENTEIPSSEKTDNDEGAKENEDEKMETETEENKKEEEYNSDDDILEIEEIRPHIESYDILDDDDEEEEELNKEKLDEENKSEVNDGRKDSGEENDVEIDEFNSTIVVKQEPPDLINTNTMTNTSHINETIYLDGNSEIIAPKISLPKRIKINISSVLNKNTDESSNSVPETNEETEKAPFEYAEPLPPGEEEVLTGHVKPQLIGKRMFEMPPVNKGKEMSGLCSIM